MPSKSYTNKEVSRITTATTATMQTTFVVFMTQTIRNEVVKRLGVKETELGTAIAHSGNFWTQHRQDLEASAKSNNWYWYHQYLFNYIIERDLPIGEYVIEVYPSLENQVHLKLPVDIKQFKQYINQVICQKEPWGLYVRAIVVFKAIFHDPDFKTERLSALKYIAQRINRHGARRIAQSHKATHQKIANLLQGLTYFDDSQEWKDYIEHFMNERED